MEKTAEKYRAQFGAPRGAGAYITRLVYALVTVALGNSYILVKTGAAPASGYSHHCCRVFIYVRKTLLRR